MTTPVDHPRRADSAGLITWLIVAVTCALPCGPPSVARAQSIEDLETIVPALMRQYDVPGVALTAVRNDAMEFLRGFGLRIRGSRLDLPMTSHPHVTVPRHIPPS